MKNLNCILIVPIVIFICGCENINKPQSNIEPIPLSQLEVKGELLTRVIKNYARLEEPRYQPNYVFLTDEESGNWPGDTEGRTILGLVMAAQATHREPLYLEEMMEQLPKHLNSLGYMGKIYPAGTMDEQQLAGNGWVLRALCEYYEWKKDERVLDMVKSLANNLFVSGKGQYKKYPIDPKNRKYDGGMIGQIKGSSDGWKTSGDIGCVFIGMTGAIHAYQYTKDEKLKEVIDEMVERFLQIDMYGLKIQVHAGLTALLGLVRYAEITGDVQLWKEVEKRWDLYVKYGMTENYEIYNWFGIYDKWTESCGLIDSYLLATDLWKHTQNPKYLAYLDLIYYNGICHIERANGGFGCDNNPGTTKDFVNVFADEAWWCCTMRGGEGLSRVAESIYFTMDDTLYVTRYMDNNASFKFGKKSAISVKQSTEYPFNGKVIISIIHASSAENIVVKLNALPEWSENLKVSINDVNIPVEIQKGFVVLKHKWAANDIIRFSFDEKLRMEGTINKENTSDLQKKVFYGPLLLGYSGDENIAVDDISQIEIKSSKMRNKKDMQRTDFFYPNLPVFTIKDSKYELTPIYHLMSPYVKVGNYKKQFLFTSKH